MGGTTMIRADRYAVCGQRINTGQDETCLNAMAVVVKGQVIEDLVSQDSLPSDLPVEWHADCTLMPGLIDCHGHVEDWTLPLYLQHGVTTIRDTGNEPRYILDRRARMRQPEAVGPHIVCYGPCLDGYPYIHENISWGIKTPDDIELAIDTLVGMGVDGIKLYARLGAEKASRAVMVCKDRGLHVTSHFEGELKAVDAVRLGVLEIQHMHEVPDPYDQAIIDEIVQHGTWVCPTQSLWEASLIYGQQLALRKPIFDRIPFGNIRIHNLEFMKREQVQDPDLAHKKHFCEKQRDYVKGMIKAGGRLLAGTDAPCQMSLPGISLIDELIIFTECGLSNSQALATATSIPADLLKQNTGRLQKGCRADILAIDGNPLERIEDLYRVSAVYKAGFKYLPKELAAIDLSLYLGGCMPLIHRPAESCEYWQDVYIKRN